MGEVKNPPLARQALLRSAETRVWPAVCGSFAVRNKLTFRDIIKKEFFVGQHPVHTSTRVSFQQSRVDDP